MDPQKLVQYTSIGLGVIFVGLIVYFGIIQLSHQGKTKVDISILPNDADITLNGTAVRPGTTYIPPGEYTLIANRSGFQTHQEVLNIKNGTDSISIMMEASSEEGEKWISDHTSLYQEFEARSGKEVIESGQSFYDANPIVADLPFRNSLFVIGYEHPKDDPDSEKIIVTIDAPYGYRESAIYQIEQLGYKPADYQIRFNNYENPFAL